ncbi:MAG: sialidase family protein [bacterium]
MTCASTASPADVAAAAGAHGAAAGGRASSAYERPAAALAGTSAAPVLAVTADGAFLLAWEQRADGESDIVFRRREPGTRGWVEPARRLDTDAPGAARSIEPRIAAGPGGLVLVAWQDARTGTDQIRLNRSTDGGRSWWKDDVAPGAPREAADSARVGPATLPFVAVDGTGRAYLAWEDRRDGWRDVYLARSLDAGATWQTPVRADSDPPGRGISYHPQILAWDDGTMLVCWWDERDGRADVYVRRSTDAGASWTGPEVRIDPGEAGRTASHEVRLERHGDSVAISWQEGFDPASPSYLVRTSPDRGATWDDVRPLAARAPAAARATAANGESLHAWVDDGGKLRVRHRAAGSR